MTAAEMQYSFQEKATQYGIVDNLPSYSIEYYLNEAQINVVNTILEEGYDKNERNRRVLDKLIRFVTPSAASLQATIFPSDTTTVYTISDEVHRILMEICEGTYNSNSTLYDGIDVTNISIKPIREDYYNANKDNPHKKPYGFLAWRLEQYDSANSEYDIILITSNDIDITSYKVRYVKKPTSISILNSISSELDSIVHKDIVNEAVRLYKEDVLSQPQAK